MLRLTQRINASESVSGSLTLTLDQRIKSRLRVELDDGTEAGLFLERGLILRDGDLIASDDGVVIVIKAAPETVSTVRSNDALLISRACYHLGNRHVPLQITADLIRYQHDHVLDAMVRGLGLTVICEKAPFEPEAGAYSGHAHAHAHPHDHAH